MNAYKKIIPKKLRFSILRALRFIPDKPTVKMQYFLKTKRRLHLKNPVRFSEKLQWYKLYYRNDLMPICSDKYRVREHLKVKGLEKYLVPLYAVYDNAEEIDYEALPDQFVLKTTNGSGTNILCRDKSRLPEKEIQEKVKGFLKQSSASAGREWPYALIIPKIVVEKLIEDPLTDDDSLCDYKFFCFNGKPQYITFHVNRQVDHRCNVYDTDWNDLHIIYGYPASDKEYTKPENFDEMLGVAETLAADFPFVRVDLYNVAGKIYFGELTFFPASGYFRYEPDSFDIEAGKMFVLPEPNVKK